MKLWLISQDANSGYDTYDSVVVAANTADEARSINPDGDGWNRAYGAWAPSPELVKVELIGEAAVDVKPGIVLASFNAG